MSSPAPTPAKAASEPTPERHRLDPLAGLLSYLIPGLGQISQGRVAKGVLFLVSLHVLFAYGMWLGHGKNVFLPRASKHGGALERLLSDLYARPHFAGQFFIGMAAWPAVYQYIVYEPKPDRIPLGGFQRAPTDDEINQLQ